MAAPLLIAAARMVKVLTAENVALRALDASAATALLQEKLAAARGLAEASAVRPAPPQTPEMAGLALQLRDLAAENQRLLERTMQVQARVLDMVARAARQEASQVGGRYIASGVAVPDRGAVTLHMRA